MANGLPESFDPDRKYSGKELAEIAMVLKETIFKNNPSGTTPTNNPPYGPYADGSGDYGAFSIPGFRPGMFSAFTRPRSISSQLGVMPSLNTNEKIGIMTGVTGESGTNPTGFCGTLPTAGQLKRCIQNYVWGSTGWKSAVVNLMEVGERIDYSDYVDHNLMNQRAKQNPFVPDIMAYLDLANRSEITLANELFTIGVAMERAFEQVLIKGNPALAPAASQRGYIKEFAGLEQQITTGKRDLDSGLVCPAADSFVSTWGTGIDATVNGVNIVQYIRNAYFGLQEMARQVGMEGVTFGIVMPFRMFQALTYVWACNYWTYACAGSVTNPSYTNAETVRTLQLDMQNNYYLLIDGNRVPVFPSDGITETNASATVITGDDLFILPLEWNGMRLLNLQYKNLSTQDIMSFGNYGGLAPTVQPISNGMYLMSKNMLNYCLEYNFAAKFRIIQEAPFLAAKLNVFQYTFAQPFRSPYPSDTANHKNGGTTRWDGNYSVLGG